MYLGHDNGRVYAEWAERDVTVVIPPHRNSGLKYHHALARLRVQGIEGVRLHADLTNRGRLPA